jgi:hypothetical protein
MDMLTCCFSLLSLDQWRPEDFFFILAFLINIWEMNLVNFFSPNLTILNRKFVQRDLRMSHVNTHNVTCFYVNISCHVNSIRLILLHFLLLKMSHHFEWRDFNESAPPFWMWLILGQLSLFFYLLFFYN